MLKTIEGKKVLNVNIPFKKYLTIPKMIRYCYQSLRRI